MARLNEPPVSSDSLETLRKKMLRQNRDLAKSNNVRALRIRELENDCACMLSENLELRSRILELERQVEDNEARRIADHAMVIKEKLESQLTEWGILLAGLGLEPPMKRHSPRIRKSTKHPMSFSANRPSPSQRRLRDIARDIEDLGHISETKSYPRRSMNHEQILALRSEADISVESPELGPPPMSKFIDDDPIKIDSPSRVGPNHGRDFLSPTKSPMGKILEPPVSLASPKFDKAIPLILSPEKKELPVIQQQPPVQLAETLIEEPVAKPVKAGSKRKLAARDEGETIRSQRVTNENEPPKFMSDKPSIHEKAGGKTLKELASMRKEARDKHTNSVNPRKPLAPKNTNDDVSSPKKNLSKTKAPLVDGMMTAKPTVSKAKMVQDKVKSKPKDHEPAQIETVTTRDITPPHTATAVCELGVPIVEPGLLSPNSPEPITTDEDSRGGTPPPADINLNGETSRPSRRNRAAISYAEPNLRVKMRRPTKELFDAVAGEGKYPRRISQCDVVASEPIHAKRESDVSDSWKTLPEAEAQLVDPDADTVPAYDPRKKNSNSSGMTKGSERLSSIEPIDVEITTDCATEKDASQPKEQNPSSSTSDAGDMDIYEFTSSSPRPDKETMVGTKRRGRPPNSSRRSATLVDSDSNSSAKERNSSRRRSMMI